MQPRPPSNSLSFRQKIEIIKWLMRFPALTVMVFLRRDLGYRLVNPFHVLIACVSAAFTAMFVQSYNRTASLNGFFQFLVVVFVFGMAQRIRGWRQINRGICLHSYYIGTSPFDRPWMPAFCRRNRRIARFIDPIFCIVIGLPFLDHYPAIALWIAFAGMCLRAFEDVVFRKERNTTLDTMDGLIVAGVQGQTVDTYQNPLATSPKQQTAGIPTGLAPDIREHMKRRRAK